MTLKPGHYGAGGISSLQNNEKGIPTWIVSGNWKSSLSEIVKSGNYSGNGNQAENQTLDTTFKSNSNTNASAENSPQLKGRFQAVFDMVRTNGSGLHSHQIYNLTLTDISMPNKSTTLYNGTVTIAMKDGPVHDVPISIMTLEGNVIRIWVDPSKVQNHFGNTPIYGTILKAIEVKK